MGIGAWILFMVSLLVESGESCTTRFKVVVKPLYDFPPGDELPPAVPDFELTLQPHDHKRPITQFDEPPVEEPPIRKPVKVADQLWIPTRAPLVNEESPPLPLPTIPEMIERSSDPIIRISEPLDSSFMPGDTKREEEASPMGPWVPAEALPLIAEPPLQKMPEMVESPHYPSLRPSKMHDSFFMPGDIRHKRKFLGQRRAGGGDSLKKKYRSGPIRGYRFGPGLGNAVNLLSSLLSFF